MLEDIKTNITRLIALYEGEKQRADALESSLRGSEALIEQYKAQITDLNSKIDNLKLSMAFTGRGDNELAKARIEKLIREIDKCIKMLEQ